MAIPNDSNNPVEVFNKLHQYVLNYDADGQAELFAKDGIWEFPFATNGLPKIITGRENIRSFGQIGMERSRAAGRKITAYTAVRVYETQEKNTIIVEFVLEVEIAAAQTSYKLPYIQVLTTQGGEITLLRDYFSMEILKSLISHTGS